MREHKRKMIRHFMAVFLTVAFVITGPVSTFAAAAKLIPVPIATDISTDAIIWGDVYWSDDWFSEPSTSYNHELAVTSIAFAGASYLEESVADHSDSDMRQALLDFGFDDGTMIFYNYDYPYSLTDSDVVAYTLASKYVGDDLLIAIIIRGTNTESEWYSDVRVSADGTDPSNAVEHYGFYQAEKELTSNLAEYVTWFMDNNDALTSQNIKFYVTGHSRGGSVADILASELDDIYGMDKVYAYTFAAPAVAVRAKEGGYENIFNILNADDRIAEMPFSKFDFELFGVDKVMASAEEEETPDDDIFSHHYPSVYYDRLRTGWPDTLFE